MINATSAEDQWSLLAASNADDDPKSSYTAFKTVDGTTGKCKGRAMFEQVAMDPKFRIYAHGRILEVDDDVEYDILLQEKGFVDLKFPRSKKWIIRTQDIFGDTTSRGRVITINFERTQSEVGNDLVWVQLTIPCEDTRPDYGRLMEVALTFGSAVVDGNIAFQAYKIAEAAVDKAEATIEKSKALVKLAAEEAAAQSKELMFRKWLQSDANLL